MPLRYGDDYSNASLDDNNLQSQKQLERATSAKRLISAMNIAAGKTWKTNALNSVNTTTLAAHMPAILGNAANGTLTVTKAVHQWQEKISGTDLYDNPAGYFHFNINTNNQNYGIIHVYLKAIGSKKDPKLPDAFEICAASYIDRNDIWQFVYPSP